MASQGTGPDDRATAWSRQLAQAHDALREQLRSLRQDPGLPAAGDGLTAHCLAFCSALTAHHEGEDSGMFAELLRARPGLHPVVTKLAEDHRLIAGILASVRDRAREAAQAGPGRREAIRRELDGLAAIMESHFGYEERALGQALDQGVRDTGWTTSVFGLTGPEGDGAPGQAAVRGSRRSG
ncbi:MAG TPA: hemerythrin domain-containing protein [Streptosporangiaceae bacterium]|jgi:hypothetical protein|nr:hemerythrin domain-containing protein [Streptosporangiaceae bacterium]